jgi:hypothetical protein
MEILNVYLANQGSIIEPGKWMRGILAGLDSSMLVPWPTLAVPPHEPAFSW